MRAKEFEMFALSYKGEINDENVYDTFEEAERAREEEIRDACREDARDGCYSKRREAFYWHALQVVEL